MLYLRYPGRMLEAGEMPPRTVLDYIAGQVGVQASGFEDYALRDATRGEHLAELMRLGGYGSFSRTAAAEMVGFLATPAQTIVRPSQLAGILVEELRRRRVLLPFALVLEAVIRLTERLSTTAPLASNPTRLQLVLPRSIPSTATGVFVVGPLLPQVCAV